MGQKWDHKYYTSNILVNTIGKTSNDCLICFGWSTSLDFAFSPEGMLGASYSNRDDFVD